MTVPEPTGTCGSCGAGNRAGAKFCRECGGSLRKEAVCAACGWHNEPDQRFCDECGAVLAVEQGPAAPARPPSGAPAAFGRGRYEVLRLLGEGGMKRVYLARDTRLGREVAISAFKADVVELTALARARREAEAMARLGDHPNVVTIHDIGEEQHQLFFVSQFMSAGDLTGLLAQAQDGRLAIEEAVRIAIDIACGLEHAHSHGVVHRDLKPQNVWLTPDGTAKLGDFGLAVAADSSRLTAEGAMVGTVAYMSPEQGLGRPCDARSDLYSLGALLYELICGTPPFVGDGAAAVISQHVSAVPVGPAWHRADVPQALEQLVLKLLAKKPEQRFQSAAEVRAALEGIRSTAAGVAAPEDEAVRAVGRLAAGDVPFVGREREVGTLRAAVDEALAGRGKVVVVAGEAGIGKTRLATAIDEYASLRGAQVLWGRCSETEGAPAFWPWVQALRAYVHARDPEELRAELGSGASDIAQVVSEVRARLPGLAEPQALDPDQARFRLFDSITTFLVNASARRPVALFLEDLHLADTPSLRLLQFMAQSLGSTRVLVLVTYRDTELEPDAPLRDVLTALARGRGYTHLVLRGLSTRDVKAVLEQSSEQTLSSSEEIAFVEAVSAESGGNPYFIEEIVRHVLESGAIYQRDGRWVSDARHISELGIPRGIKEVVDRRLARLSAACRATLVTAAAIGQEFGLEVLERVSGAPAATLVGLLREASDAGVVHRMRHEANRYRFEHVATRDALYQELTPADRMSVHNTIGEALEELHEDRIEAHLGELAHHFAQAAPAGVAGKAAEYAWWAGERAASLFAYDESVELYERALELFDTLPEEPVRRCELLLALGEARLRAGDRARAEETFTEAAEIAQRLSLPDQYARAALGHAGGPGGFTVSDTADDRVVELLRGALALQPDRDSVLRVRVMARLAVELSYMSDDAEVDRLSRAAVEAAERIGDARTVLLALCSRQWATIDPDGLEDDLEAIEQIVRLARVAGDREIEFQGHHLRLNALLQLGDLRGVDREIRACERLAKDLREPRHEWQASVFRVMRTLLQGRFKEGERLAGAAAAIGQRGLGEAALVVFGAHTFLTRWAEGNLAEIADGGEHFAARYPRSAWPAALVWLRCEVGDHARARAEFDALASDGFRGIRRDANWLTAMACLSMACIQLEDAEAARTLYEMLAPYADRCVTVLTGAACLGSAHTFAGMLAATAGMVDSAIEHFERGERVNDRIGGFFALARIAQHHALTLLRRGAPGDGERAAELLERGLEKAREFGLPKEAERLLAIKLDSRGLGALDVRSSIEAVARSVEQTRPDIAPAAAPDGTVTLMFSDIEDSTVLTERLGDQRWLELLKRHNDILRRSIAAHGGYEVKSQGDGLMVAFASGRRALTCAIDVQLALDEFRRRHPDEPLRVRIGLHTGEALRDKEDFFGKNVILAARIAASARGDEILVSALMRDLVASTGDFRFSDERELQLKGLSGKYRVFSVAWTQDAPRSAGAAVASLPLPPGVAASADAVLVGRDAALDDLEQHTGGAGGLVVLSGEPGVGKTALASAFARRAHAAGAAVLYGRCEEQAVVPYQPFVEALEHYVRLCPLERLRREVGERVGGELARLLPALTDRLPALEVPSREDPEVERYRLFSAVGALLAEAGRAGPVLVVLDDLHWADQATLLLLRHVARAADRNGLLLLGTYRDSDLHRGHPLPALLADLRGEQLLERLALTGLAQDDVGRLIAAFAGGEPPPELTQAVFVETEGNPLFVREVVRHLGESGVIAERDGRLVARRPIRDMGIPEGIREVIGRRLSRLSDVAGEVLATASAIGREFSRDVLERVTGVPTDVLVVALEEALAAQMIEEVPRAAGRFTFAHALVRQALYDRLSAVRRERLHERIGEVLELVHADDPEPHLTELAHHFLLASGRGDRAKALDYSARAGTRAFVQVAYEEAAGHFECALEVLGTDGDPARRLDLLLALGEARWRSGDFDTAREAYAEAADLARAAGAHERLAVAALGYGGGIAFEAGRLDDRLIGLLEDALAVLGEVDSALRARVMSRLAEALTFSADGERSRRLAREAIAVARRSGDQGALAHAVHRAHWVTWSPDNLSDRLAAAREAIRLAELVGDSVVAMEARAFLIGDLLESADIEAVGREIEGFVRGAQELGISYYLWFAAVLEAMQLLLAGSLEAGAQRSSEALAIGAEAQNRNALQLYAAQFTLLPPTQQHLDGSTLFVEQYPAVTAWRCVRAFYRSQLGEPDAARADLRELTADDCARIPRDMFWFTGTCLLAEAAHVLGERDAAATLYDLLSPYAGRCAAIAPCVACLGPVARHLGLLASTLERFDDAARHFDAAVVMSERLGAAAWLERTREDQVRLAAQRRRSVAVSRPPGA